MRLPPRRDLRPDAHVRRAARNLLARRGPARGPHVLGGGPVQPGRGAHEARLRGSTPSQFGAVLLSANDEAAIKASQGSTATPAPAIVNISKFCTQVPDLVNLSAALFKTVSVSGVLAGARTFSTCARCLSGSP